MATPVGINPDTLPTRVNSRTDLDEARSWLAVIQSDGGASDGETYETMSEARNIGMRIARLVTHVAPDGLKPSVRTFGVGKDGATTADPEAIASFGFLVTLKAPSADEAKGNGKAAKAAKA